MRNLNLVVKGSNNGRRVFANRDFRERELILKFIGRIFRLEEIPDPYDSVEDHYVQIGPKLYMGPSGGIDDLINHSCDPNSGLVISDIDIQLIAIKDIKLGEEIMWDYSTTMDEDDWEMDCNCNAENCRKRIRDFKYLPSEVKQKYIKLGTVPSYILRTEACFNIG